MRVNLDCNRCRQSIRSEANTEGVTHSLPECCEDREGCQVKAAEFMAAATAPPPWLCGDYVNARAKHDRGRSRVV